MKGHDRLIAERRAGTKIHSVWITDSDDAYAHATAATWHMNPHHKTGEIFAHLRIEASDLPEALDLVGVKGLQCHVASDRGDARFLRLFQAVCDAGACAVAGLSEGHVHVFKPTATEESTA